MEEKLEYGRIIGPLVDGITEFADEYNFETEGLAAEERASLDSGIVEEIMGSLPDNFPDAYARRRFAQAALEFALSYRE